MHNSCFWCQCSPVSPRGATEGLKGCACGGGGKAPPLDPPVVYQASYYMACMESNGGLNFISVYMVLTKWTFSLQLDEDCANLSML